MAIVYHAALYANPYRQNDGKTLSDKFPQIFEDKEDDDDEGPDLSQYTDEYIAECQDMMKDYKFG